MEKIKELLKERDELLLEHGRLKDMHSVIKCGSDDLKKELRQLWRGTIFKFGVARIEKVQDRYFKRLLKKLKELGDLSVKKKGDNKFVSAADIEKELLVYVNSIAKRTSLYGGSIGQLLNKKEVDWDLLEEEIISAQKDITSLLALLDSLIIAKGPNEVTKELQLKTFGFPVDQAQHNEMKKLLLSKWSDTLKMKEALGENCKILFSEVLPSSLIKQLIINDSDLSIVSWKELVKTLPLIVKQLIPLNISLKEEEVFTPNLFSKMLLNKIITWSQFTRDLPQLLKSSGKIVLEEGTPRDAVTIQRTYHLQHWGELPIGMVKKPDHNFAMPVRIINNPQDWENRDKILAKIQVNSYRDIFAYLSWLILMPTRSEEPLRNLVAQLMTKTFSQERMDIERFNFFGRYVMSQLDKCSGLNDKSRYLLRKVFSLLPLSGNRDLINRIRQYAIDLNDATELLGPLRQKIHNFPGKEDIEIITAYGIFLESGNIQEFQKSCQKYNLNLQVSDLKLKWAELKEKTQKIVPLLLQDLDRFWNLQLKDVALQQAKMAYYSSNKNGRPLFGLPLKEYSEKLQLFFREIDQLIEEIERKNHRKASKTIGHLRFDCREFLRMGPTDRDFRIDLHYFDLFLEGVELQIHTEVLKKIKINSFKDVEDLIDMIINKAHSLYAAHQIHISLGEAIYYLEEFKKTKDVRNLRDALDYLTFGIDTINDSVVKEFRRIFREQMNAGNMEMVTDKQLEEMVSPFYRTGPIFQFDQLIEILRELYQNRYFKKALKKSKKLNLRTVIEKEPRTVTTHLWEKVYAKFGL